MTNNAPNTTTTVLPSASLPLPPIHFDKSGRGFWYQDEDGDWVCFAETSIKRHLKMLGYSSKTAEHASQSPLDEVLTKIERQQNVDYAGPVAGHRKGIIEMEGKMVLITEGPQLITPQEGNCYTILQLISGMLGGIQTACLMCWWKISYEALRDGLLIPGQALVFAGPVNSGKTLLIRLITASLGGRSAHPYLFMTGGTTFNAEQFGAETLIIDDEMGKTDIKSRKNLGAAFKRITVGGSQLCHPKGKTPVTLRPFWRLLVSVNDDPESLLVLPIMGEDIKDKVMLFKVTQGPMPMDTNTAILQERFWNRLLAELPAFLHELESWEIPGNLRECRFGIDTYHDPEILEAIDDLSPEIALYRMLEIHSRSRVSPWVSTAEEIESYLIREEPHQAGKIFTFNNACARYLGRLANKHPHEISEAPRRSNLRYWQIIFQLPIAPTPGLVRGPS